MDETSSVFQRKDGVGWTKLRQYSTDALLGATARFLDDTDRLIAAELALLRHRRYERGTAEELCAHALRSILATGRAFYRSLEDSPLRLGEPRVGHVGWTLYPDGSQHVCVLGDDPHTIVLATAAPWYVDLQSSLCGPLDVNVPPRLLEALLDAPPIDPPQAAAVSQAFSQRFDALPAVLAPRPKIIEEQRAVVPAPLLSLAADTQYIPRSYYSATRMPHLQHTVAATLQFDYAGTVASTQTRATAFRFVEGDRIVVVPRDTAAEEAALERITALLPASEDPPTAWARFARETIPALEADGWRVTAERHVLGDLLDFSVPDAHWDTLLTTRGDWFDIDVGVEVDGKRHALLPLILDVLKQLQSGEALEGDVTYVQQGQRVLALPTERVRAILDTLTELYDERILVSGGKIVVNRLAAIGAAGAFPNARPQDETASQICDLATRFAGFTGIADVPVPRALHATLRPYQHQGYRWLQFLREFGCGGILADDMGLGKTVQTIAHILREKQARRLTAPALLVVPTSVLPNWLSELERFAPSLRVTALHGAQRKERFAKLDTCDVAITTYALLARDPAFARRSWHLAIFDEAQALKNPQTNVARAAASLQATQRICLTGTPMENHLGELWSLFDIVMPGALYDRTRFARTFRTPIEKHGDHARREALARRIRPFLLRRTKADVELQLPDKTEIIERVELATDQRDLYETVRVAVHEGVQREIARVGIARSRIAVLDALLKLRQACCDPRLVKLSAAARVKSSAKLEWLIETLQQLAAEGRRTLIFSQFTSMIDLIKPRLTEVGIPYVELVGSTVDRATPVRRFQSDEVPVFLISLKAGGTGLNLTAADTVIHYDPWWNPAVERQATDRAHRIGQEKAVFVYKLIAADTVEEKILAMQKRKAELADALFSSTTSNNINLTPEDIEALFS